MRLFKQTFGLDRGSNLHYHNGHTDNFRVKQFSNVQVPFFNKTVRECLSFSLIVRVDHQFKTTHTAEEQKIAHTLGSQLTERRNKCFANSANKEKLISMFNNKLRAKHFSVVNATLDVDVDIARLRS